MLHVSGRNRQTSSTLADDDFSAHMYGLQGTYSLMLVLSKCISEVNNFGQHKVHRMQRLSMPGALLSASTICLDYVIISNGGTSTLLYLTSKDSLGWTSLIVSQAEMTDGGETRLGLGAVETETRISGDMNFVKRKTTELRACTSQFRTLSLQVMKRIESEENLNLSTNTCCTMLLANVLGSS
jgi:hypothetical protein